MSAPRAHLTLAVLAQGVASSGGFATTLVLARTLGLEDFGRVALVLLGAGFAAGLVQALGVQPFLSLGDRAQRPARPAALVVVTVVVALLAAAIASAAAPAWTGAGALPAALAVGARAAAPAARALSFGTGRRALAVWVDALVGFGGLAGALAAARVHGPGVDAALLGLGGGAALASALALVSTAGGARRARPAAVDRRRVGAALERSWRTGRWLALTQALSWFGTGTVHVAAAGALGPAAVGALRAAQALVGAAGVLLQALELALPRAAAEARARGGLRAWVRTAGLRAALGMALLGGVLAALAGPLTAFTTASAAEAALARGALLVLACGPALGAVTCVVSVGFRAAGDRVRAIPGAYAASALCAASTAPPLVLELGVVGAALALVLGQLVYAALLVRAWGARTSQKLVCVTTGHIGA